MAYSYEKKSTLSFELCATFNMEGRGMSAVGAKLPRAVTEPMGSEFYFICPERGVIDESKGALYRPSTSSGNKRN